MFGRNNFIATEGHDRKKIQKAATMPINFNGILIGATMPPTRTASTLALYDREMWISYLIGFVLF